MKRFTATPNWRRLLLQAADCADLLAFETAGSSRLARIPMMAITTSNSTKVNPRGWDEWVGFTLPRRVADDAPGSIAEISCVLLHCHVCDESSKENSFGPEFGKG